MTHTTVPVTANHPLRRTDEDLASALAAAGVEGASDGRADAAAHGPELTADDVAFLMRLRFAGNARFDAADRAQVCDAYLSAYRRAYHEAQH